MDTTITPRRRRSARRGVSSSCARALLVTAAVGLVLAGCGDDDDTEAGGSGVSGQAMSIEIVSPSDGSEVGSSFDVTVDPSVEIGEPATGLHHVHLFYDGDTADGEYDMAFGPEFTVDHLGPGQHTIEAVVATADHRLTDARAEVTVTVGDGSVPGSTTTTEEDDSEGVGGY